MPAGQAAYWAFNESSGTSAADWSGKKAQKNIRKNGHKERKKQMAVRFSARAPRKCGRPPKSKTLKNGNRPD